MVLRVSPVLLALAALLACGGMARAQSGASPSPATASPATASPATPAPARTPPNCQAPDHYLMPKVPLRHAAQALKTDKQLRVLVFSSVRTPSIPESVEAKRYPASLTQALVARYPGRSVSVTTHTEPRAPIGESLKALKTTLAGRTFDVVVWQLGATDVLRGTDLAVFGAQLVSGIGAIRARNADAVLMTMQYSPRTDFMFDAGPYMQYLRWVAKTEGSALFNRYDVMRYWVEDGSFDLSELQPGASIFEDVHRCVGQLLARFIANGIAAPESQ